MEKALFISHIRQLDKINDSPKSVDNRQLITDGQFERIYYGTEFCQHLIPTLDNLKATFSIIKENKKKFTLLTPYVTGLKLQSLELLFQYLDNQDDNIEVVFNDWGTFKLIREKYKNIEPVLGRLLTKQRRDPRAYNILLNRQKARKVFDKKSKKTLIVIPKKVPPSLYEYFKASVINVPIFQEFLLSNGIRRLEIDNLVWDMNIEVPKEIDVSIYLPYAYVTTTRLCGLLNLTYTACRRECQKFFLSFKSYSSQVSFYSRGNTVFYKSKIPRERYLKQRHIDRVIWEPEVPI